jgi:hypothetical protein
VLEFEVGLWQYSKHRELAVRLQLLQLQFGWLGSLPSASKDGVGCPRSDPEGSALTLVAIGLDCLAVGPIWPVDIAADPGLRFVAITTCRAALDADVLQGLPRSAGYLQCRFGIDAEAVDVLVVCLAACEE